MSRNVGALAWAVLAVSVAAYMLGLFHRVAPAAMAADLARDFATSAAALGLLSATYFWVYTAMQVPCGVLADTLGPRALLLWGGLVAAGGAALFGLAPSLGVAAAGRTLVGLGTAVAFVATLKLIANWFEERRFATLTGGVVLLGNLSSAAAGAPFAWLLELASWRTVMLALAALSVAVALLVLWIVRDAPAPRGAHARFGPSSWRGGLAAVVVNPASWPIFLANVGMGGAFMSFAGLWAVPYFVEVHGLTRVAAANHATVMLTSFAVAGLAIGAFSDRIGRRKPVFLAGALLGAASWIPLLAGVPLAGTPGFAVSIGMGVGAAGFTIGWTCAKEVNAPQYSGIATAFVNVGIFLGPAILQPLVGWVLDVGEGGASRTAESWRAGIATLAAFAGCGLASVLAVRETFGRNIVVAAAHR